jgi:hypothetical protein
MTCYDFKVRGDDETVLVLRSVELPDLRAVWAEVARLANDIDAVGGRVVVTDAAGEVLILVGVVTARSFGPRSQPAPRYWEPERQVA